MNPSKSRRLVLLAAVAVVLALLGLGAWLLLSGTSERDRVEAAVNELVIAVESEDVARVGASIHEDYAGWMIDKETGLAGFEAALPRIESLNIRLRNLDVVLDESETEAEVKFDWTYTMILSTGELGKVDTSRILEDAWAPASLLFVQDEAGQWLLFEGDTDLPQFKPKKIGGQ